LCSVSASAFAERVSFVRPASLRHFCALFTVFGTRSLWNRHSLEQTVFGTDTLWNFGAVWPNCKLQTAHSLHWSSLKLCSLEPLLAGSLSAGQLIRINSRPIMRDSPFSFSSHLHPQASNLQPPTSSLSSNQLANRARKPQLDDHLAAELRHKRRALC